MKSKTTALILSIFLGGLGVDRFYLGHTGMGLLKLFTGGVFGIMYVVDIIMILTGKMTTKDGQSLA
ncbi:MAG: TM2 domain-containing protein [Clostridiaceae bacterium]|nr:TM2 domain-containing protein [Clostridiaceae bacterium]